MGKKDSSPRRRALIFGAAVGVGSLVVVPATIYVVGFTTVGVAAGSIAAIIQTPVTAAGSIFAGCQSAGVLGLAGSTKAAIAATSGGAAYIGEIMFQNLPTMENQMKTHQIPSRDLTL